jgi:hypothetical protein
MQYTIPSFFPTLIPLCPPILKPRKNITVAIVGIPSIKGIIIPGSIISLHLIIKYRNFTTNVSCGINHIIRLPTFYHNLIRFQEHLSVLLSIVSIQ